MKRVSHAAKRNFLHGQPGFPCGRAGLPGMKNPAKHRALRDSLYIIMYYCCVWLAVISPDT